MTIRHTIPLLVTLVSLGSPILPSAEETQPRTRTIYASATDRGGRPVLDMRTADFEVKEGGKVQTISATLATAPLRVALIVSDGGRGQFQYGAHRFCEALLGHAEISIIGVVVDFEVLADYTKSGDTLRTALLRLGKSTLGGRGASARLTETILHVARGIRREGYRSAMVVMRAGGETVPGFGSEMARAVIRESGAVMQVLSATSADDSYPEFGILTVEAILNDGSRDSGGRHIEVLGTSTASEMERIAAELINQYEITYMLAAGVKPSDRMSVSSMRRGVTVRAPSWVAR